MPVLCYAIVTAEEIPGHFELAQLEVLGAIVEHVRETSIRPEHPGIGGSNLRDKVEHEVTLRGSHPRESHSSERAHVLSSDGPTPESLDAVHHIHSVNKES